MHISHCDHIRLFFDTNSKRSPRPLGFLIRPLVVCINIKVTRTTARLLLMTFNMWNVLLGLQEWSVRIYIYRWYIFIFIYSDKIWNFTNIWAKRMSILKVFCCNSLKPMILYNLHRKKTIVNSINYIINDHLIAGLVYVELWNINLLFAMEYSGILFIKKLLK